MLATVPPAMADVNLNLPKTAEVLTVNGKQPGNSSDLILADGTNQIAFRYAAQYRQQADSVHYLSDVLIVRFDESAQTLTLKLPAINSARDAKKFDESPKLILVNAQDESVSFAQDKLVKNGLQIGRDFEHEMLQYNLGEHPASLNITITAAVTQPNDTIAPPSANQPQIRQASAVASTSLIMPTVMAPTVATVNDQTQQNTSVTTPSQAEISQMLDYWYKLANDNTKANFKAKINQE
jgi:hypothetical protein